MKGFLLERRTWLILIAGMLLGSLALALKAGPYQKLNVVPAAFLMLVCCGLLIARNLYVLSNRD